VRINCVDCEAGLERAVRARVVKAFKKWREIASLQQNRSIPLKYEIVFYESCVRSLML